jgi:uncharacterized damage-inducible protein DinB
MLHGDTARLAEGNLAFLRQALELVRRMSDDDYRGTTPELPRGGVGAQFRHIFDHYDCFLRGLDGGRIDYDVRERDPRLECERGCALDKLGALSRDLASLPHAELRRSVQVALDCGEGDERIWSTSTVARELQFLVSHTVHHFAVIAVMLRRRGFEPGDDFGVAPSTLKYEQGLAVQPGGAVCAR